MQSPVAKRLSCGIVVVNDERELLLCHVTGHDHWDLPKGGLDAGESPLQAALRETREETGLLFDAADLLELGRFEYGARKALHLFAARVARFDLGRLSCESHFSQAWSGLRLPEMDDYGWFAFERAAALCSPKMARVLADSLTLGSLAQQIPRLAPARFAPPHLGHARLVPPAAANESAYAATDGSAGESTYG